MNGPSRDLLGFFEPSLAPPPREGATPLSDGAAAGGGARRVLARVACASLGVASLAMTTGCLITDPPQFKPPKHTRPFLDATTASPDPKEVIVIKGKPGVTGIGSKEFSASFTSQDDTGDGDFNEVKAFLYIDLGFQNPFDPLAPFVQVIPTTVTQAEGGSLSQTGRTVSAKWHLGPTDVALGCHRATLVVSHIFDATPCPVCNDDWSAITWQILRCDESNGDCGAMPLTGPTSCEGLTMNSCGVVRDAQIHSDAGVPECPSGASDAGAL